MWVFLASEVLFFSGLFITYAIYRSFNAAGFPYRRRAYRNLLWHDQHRAAPHQQPDDDGCLARRDRAVARLTLVCLALTARSGFAFLLCKGLEYHDDLAKHLVPGPGFPLSPPATQMFWGVYWIMTGIHAIHLTAGIGVVTVVVLFERRIIPVQGSTMEGVAIYWHFVDWVWLVLFPLLYLVGRS